MASVPADPARRITVTVSPDGFVQDVAVGGHSVSHAIPTRGASLTLEHHSLPVLYLSLIADEIVMKPKETPDAHG